MEGGGPEEDEEDDDDDPHNWLIEYNKGCDWEIYPTELADVFEGTLFSDLSQTLYLKLNITLFALKITERSKRGGVPFSRLLINPPNFRIPSKRNFIVEGFVIAKVFHFFFKNSLFFFIIFMT